MEAERQGDRRRGETRETVPYLCKQQHARPWQHKHSRARQDWHAKSLWHMLARWYPVCSRLARTDTHTHGGLSQYPLSGEGGEKGEGQQHDVYVLYIINAFTSG